MFKHNNHENGTDLLALPIWSQYVRKMICATFRQFDFSWYSSIVQWSAATTDWTVLQKIDELKFFSKQVLSAQKLFCFRNWNWLPSTHVHQDGVEEGAAAEVVVVDVAAEPAMKEGDSALAASY